MISVCEATALIQSVSFHSRREVVGIGDAVGRILAEPIFADRDLPPFNRVTMDGIAISSGEFLRGRVHFKILDTLAAGQPAVSLSDPAGCIEIMTGAMLPEGTDTVVRYEDLIIKDGIAAIQIPKISTGDFIHIRSSDAKISQELLSPGIKLSPAEIALVASVGKVKVSVTAFPKTAIISTGDELVEIDQTPLPHQIRCSNAYALQAALREINCSSDHFHIADQKDTLLRQLTEILAGHELIILSGGVSKGKYDFVPEVLNTLGIRRLFHQVSQRPGKPFWFGTSDRHTVFALPGNPVSTYMCFYRYIKPWLLQAMTASFTFPKAELAVDYSFSPSLTYFLQVKIKNENGKLLAFPDAGGGSGDFANLREVDGFLELPDGARLFKAGEVFSFIPFRYF
jgi:molybdopterin molybdotransferase